MPNTAYIGGQLFHYSLPGYLIKWGQQQFTFFDEREMENWFTRVKADCFSRDARDSRHSKENAFMPLEQSALPRVFEKPCGSISHRPNDMPSLRAQFSAHYTHGQLIGSWNCGIISGMATLWEYEGMEMVSTALEEIFPWHDFRPSILFYDNACKLRRWRNNNPVLSWAGTRHIVDRFHFLGHREFDCSEFCSPEARDDPYLWDVDPATGAETFRWNSSMAESNNAWLHGFGDIVKQMPRVLGQFFLNEAALVRNEITLKEKLLRFHPSFAA